MKTDKKAKRLSQTIIANADPAAKPYRIWDAVVPQLHIRIQPSGVKSWNVQWSRTASKSLGRWPTVTAEAARTRAKAVLVETDQHGAPLAVIEANTPDPTKPITLGEFIAEHYTPWAITNQKAGQATINAIAACFGYLYSTPLRDLTALHIEQFKTKRIKAGRMPATVNRDLDRIRGALSRAVEWKLLEIHPLGSVKRAKGVDNSRVRYLAPEESTRLREALAAREALRRAHRESGNEWCKDRGGDGRPLWPDDGFTDHLMPMVLLAVNTGLRRGELFGLEWVSVNLDKRQLTVTAGTAKSRVARHVPLNREATDVLTRWKAQGGGAGLVFPSRHGGRFDNINKAWGGLVADADLADFRFHDLRHTFASRLVMAGVDLNTVRELLGHSDLAMTLRYSHLAPEHKAAAVELLAG